MKKYLTVFILFVVVVLAYFIVSNPLLVTVTGVGQVDAKPDKATIAFAIATQAESAVVASKAVEAKAIVIDSLLKAYGAKPDQIVKSQITVAPSGSTDKTKAYSASISMGVNIDNYQNASGLISSLYANGIYYASQPVLSSKNAPQLEEEAYQLAIENAKQEANKIAKANGKLLKKRMAIVQTTSGGTTSLTSQMQEKVQEGGIEKQITSDSYKISKVIQVTYKMW